MRVSLEHIAFNYDKDLSKTGSFHLRRNETQIVRIPEWRRECCSNPDCAPAGYVIANLPEVLSIQASFVCDDPKVSSVYIQALEPADGTNMLGHVAAKEVELIKGRADLVPFDLPVAQTRIKAGGIGVRNIKWKWQFSKNAKSWKEFQTTQHRVYTVLEMPSCPWEPRSDNASNIHVPWTDVLDYACEWAAGVKENTDVAATKVTNSLYGLGKKKLVRYGGGASYAHDRFDCTSFLQLLRGEIGNGPTLNCDDCATVVSTFSNVVGCDLSQAGMGDVFITHPILLLGAEEWEWCSTSFSRHEVAWKGNGGLTDPLFDACLQVDGDRKPAGTDPHHKPVQPANLVFFSSRDERSYKFCLVAQGKCNPKHDKIRRKFGPGHLGQRIITDENFLKALKEHYKFPEWKNSPHSKSRSFKAVSFSDFQRLGNAFDGWNEEAFEQYEADGFSDIIKVLIKRGLNQTRELVEITAFEIEAVERATELLLQLLGQFERLEFQRMEAPVGDVSFVNPDAGTVLFKRGGSVISIRSVGTQPTEVMLMAVDINDFLAHPYRNITNKEEK